ncbi:CaiB/BaiF CoA transferase family protein [Orrella marina]|uniref:Succinyl-CoA--benzylsuccinate CoA-transferase n=1 Tax=Orrella marina TaxID=2163011 RepID=A0A2R4XFY6_9BURK|nr:CoA transferase [Orrella marina]AWB32705.1 succinyl-CoA--benzylsuccinate CoA-transferase [Orrella marina]
MQTQKITPSNALEGITILDIAGPLGNYCGKLFADMGANVILVEPPDGAPTRKSAPFINGRDDLNASLVFQYQNTNKRSIALNLDCVRDKSVFLALARKCQIVLESEQPGVMAARGLDYQTLSKINPALIMTSVTAFGQDGPFAHWQATDLTAMGMGGMLYLAGYPDTAPMVACGEQAIGAANLFASVATMACILDAEISGQGQHIDVSMQECVVLGLENAVQFYDLEGTVRKRNAGTQRLAGTGVFACKDGFIYLMAGGIGSNRFWSITTDWLLEEKLDKARQFREPRWNDQAFLASDEAKAIFDDVFSPFARQLTKAELQAKGRARRIPVAPICDASDIASSGQREHRKFFVDIEDSKHTRIRMPGAPSLLSETPWRLERAAPELGEHNAEILNWAGFDASQVEQSSAGRGKS